MIGWLQDVNEAENYFLVERLEAPAWDALQAPSGAKNEKKAALLMAYNRIRTCRDFAIPDAPDADLLAKLKIAQCEAAYYLAIHLRGEDRRKGLQAQGVVGAGVVKESYAEKELHTIALPPIVYGLLEAVTVEAQSFFVGEIARDENKPVGEDVTEF